jgi:hypothetical protein
MYYSYSTSAKLEGWNSEERGPCLRVKGTRLQPCTGGYYFCSLLLLSKFVCLSILWRDACVSLFSQIRPRESDSDNEQHGDEILDEYIGIKTDAHGNPIGKEHHMETSQAD